MGQFFGAIVEVSNNFGARLFLSNEDYLTKTTIQKNGCIFFNTNSRLTNSAKALNRFNIDMDRAFQTIDTDIMMCSNSSNQPS